MRAARERWPWQHWRELLGLGTLTVAVPFTLYAWAALHLPAGYSSLLNTMAVPFGVLAAAWMKEDTPASARKWLGCISGFAGVALIVQLGPVEPTAALLAAAPRLCDSVRLLWDFHHVDEARHHPHVAAGHCRQHPGGAGVDDTAQSDPARCTVHSRRFGSCCGHGDCGHPGLAYWLNLRVRYAGLARSGDEFRLS